MKDISILNTFVALVKVSDDKEFELVTVVFNYGREIRFEKCTLFIYLDFTKFES